jgi:hypothetical protein
MNLDLPGLAAARAVVLAEGMSDQAALEALAERRGRALAADEFGDARPKPELTHFSEPDPLRPPGRLFQFHTCAVRPGVFLHIQPGPGPIPCRHRRSDLPGTGCRQPRGRIIRGPDA